MLYVLFTLIMLIAGIVLLFALMSRGAIRGGERVAERMIDQEDIAAAREGEAEVREREELEEREEREERVRDAREDGGGTR